MDATPAPAPQPKSQPKLRVFRSDRLNPREYPVGREVTYVDEAKTFSVPCRVIGYDARGAILEPIGKLKPL